MGIMTLVNKVKRSKGIQEVEKKRKLNIAWILENKGDLLENYPNRWVVVDEESIQLVEIDFSNMYRNMRNRGLNDTLVYYYVIELDPPPIFVTPVEIEYDWSEKAGWYN